MKSRKFRYRNIQSKSISIQFKSFSHSIPFFSAAFRFCLSLVFAQRSFLLSHQCIAHRAHICHHLIRICHQVIIPGEVPLAEEAPCWVDLAADTMLSVAAFLKAKVLISINNFCIKSKKFYWIRKIKQLLTITDIMAAMVVIVVMVVHYQTHTSHHLLGKQNTPRLMDFIC